MGGVQRVRTWLATLGPTICSSTDGAIGIPSRSIASSVASAGVPWSSASFSTELMRANSRLTTKPGASLTSTPVLRSLRTTRGGGRERLVAVCSARIELDKRHRGDRVEEVDADEALRPLERRRHLGRARATTCSSRSRTPARRPPRAREAPRA